MDRERRNTLIGAALFVLGFGLLFAFMPSMMLEVGRYSTLAAGLLAAVSVGAFFFILWLRSRSRRGD